MTPPTIDSTALRTAASVGAVPVRSANSGFAVATSIGASPSRSAPGANRQSRDRHPRQGRLHRTERWQYEWERTYTTAELVDQLPTAGGLNRLGPDLIEDLLAKAAKAIDAREGTITVQYTTVVVTAVLKDG